MTLPPTGTGADFGLSFGVFDRRRCVHDTRAINDPVYGSHAAAWHANSNLWSVHEHRSKGSCVGDPRYRRGDSRRSGEGPGRRHGSRRCNIRTSLDMDDLDAGQVAQRRKRNTHFNGTQRIYAPDGYDYHRRDARAFSSDGSRHAPPVRLPGNESLIEHTCTIRHRPPDLSSAIQCERGLHCSFVIPSRFRGTSRRRAPAVLAEACS
jgi:hypothetical protein